jgi:hypothetical protein
MKLSFILLQVCLAGHFSIMAQRAIDLSYIEDSKGHYIFSCTNNAHCHYVIEVKFPILVNGHADQPLPYVAEVKPGLTRLFTVTPEPAKGDMQMKYTFAVSKGCLSSSVHPDPDFTYVLPVARGKEVQVYRVTNPHATDSSYAIRIKMKPGDTIYAARAGVVNEVFTGNSENDAGVQVTGEWNSVEIVHPDCSFAQYGVLKKNGALVKPGDQVEAGAPIGIVGGDQYGRGSDIRFNVTYYPSQPNSGIPLQFWTKHNGKGTLRHGGTYTCEFPPPPPKKAAPPKKPRTRTGR